MLSDHREDPLAQPPDRTAGVSRTCADRPVKENLSLGVAVVTSRPLDAVESAAHRGRPQRAVATGQAEWMAPSM